MAKEADVGFMIWDFESSGTISNALELLEMGKKVIVYVGRPAGLKPFAAWMTSRICSLTARPALSRCFPKGRCSIPRSGWDRTGAGSG